MLPWSFSEDSQGCFARPERPAAALGLELRMALARSADENFASP
jgi:hypothetical protein